MRSWISPASPVPDVTPRLDPVDLLTPGEHYPRAPVRASDAIWTRRFTWIVLGAMTLVVLIVMSGSVVGLQPRDTFPFFTADVRFPQLLTATTPTGGDMGAHVLLPRLLADSLLPSGRIMGWTNGWYAGFQVINSEGSDVERWVNLIKGME